MRLFPLLLCLLIISSCGERKSVLLPEIQNASITEIHDISHAYLFYDETEEDNIDFNRKNLIITTNWLINVDKRLTLEHAIPKINFLQHKKRDAKMHKNENAKNYFTCNDSSIQNLGFLEFTNVFYQTISIRDFFEYKERDETLGIILNVQSQDSYSLELNTFKEKSTEVFNHLEDVKSKLQKLINEENDHNVYLLFFSQLTFQDYIEVKAMVSELKENGLNVDTNEFIY